MKARLDLLLDPCPTGLPALGHERHAMPRLSYLATCRHDLAREGLAESASWYDNELAMHEAAGLLQQARAAMKGGPRS